MTGVQTCALPILVKLEDENNNYMSEDVEGALEEIDSKIKTIEANGYDDTQIRQNINDIKTEVGSSTLNTTNQTIKDAINEVNSQIKETTSHLERFANRDTINISIEDYKEYAEGTDYTNAMSYIINHVVNNIDRYVINFVDGKTYILNCKINKKFVTLTGNAIIKGKLEIGLDDIEGKNWYDSFMHCEILNLKFIASNNFNECLDNVDYGIRLKNARNVIIKNCYFSNMMYPIVLESRDTFLKQHNNRIRIIDCTFFVCGYNLYTSNIDKTIENGDEFMEHGDIEFRGCSCQETKKGNIYVNALDGFTCFDNIFFLERSGHNIQIRYTMRILLSGNQLFEPGLSCIKLDNSAWGSINNNHLVCSGRLSNSPAIDIVGFDPYKNIACQLVLNGNIIDSCCGDGISIAGGDSSAGMQNVVITNNVIHLKSSSYKPIKMNGYSLGCVISSNTSNVDIDKTFGFSVTANNSCQKGVRHGNAIKPIEKYIDGDQVLESLTIPTNSDYMIVFTGSNSTINSINIEKAFNGQKIYVISDWINNKIVKSDVFITKDDQDLVLNKNGYREFIYLRNKFREI